MRLIWHIAKKDLSRLKLLIGGYALLIAAKLAMGASLVRQVAPEPEWFTWMQVYGNLTIGLEVLTGYVIVAAFVHDDPLVGARADWMTRPISGARLLGAKLLGLSLVMALLPLVLALPWWLSSSYGPTEIGLAVTETLLRQTAVIVPALALAVLTSGFDRYVVWLMVIFGSGVAASFLPPIKAAIVAPEVARTREWLTLGVAAVASAAVVLNQFLSRRTGRSIAMLCAGLGGMALAAWWWPASFERFRRQESVPSAESGITLAFERAKVVRQAGHEPQLRICLAVRGVPPDLRLEGRGVAQSWEWSGVKIERGGEFGEDGFAALAPAMRALRLEPSRVDPAWFLANSDRRVRMGLLGNPVMPEGVGLNVQCEMRPAYVARMEREAPSYSLMAHLEFFRPEVIAEEPLALGGHLDRGRSHVRVAGIERREDTMRVTLIEYTPIFDWRSPGRYIGTKFSGGETGLEYFLVNRTHGDASQGQEIGVQTARFGTVAITWRTLVFRTPRTWSMAGWVQPIDWFRELTLAKIANRRVAETRQELRVGELDVTGER